MITDAFINRYRQPISMGLWMVTYEMVVESDLAVEQTQLIVDVVQANDYYDLLNNRLQESVESSLPQMTELPTGPLHIEVDLVECIELAETQKIDGDLGL